MEDFIYWRHPTLPGIKIEEVCGGECRNANVWREMACQVYCENGRDGYRELGHFRNGAPFINGSDARISISHTDGLYVVATLPETPETDLSEFSERAALGVDTERKDREQVLRVRERFLSDGELAEIPDDDVLKNVVAWTAKEAAYKASLCEGLDFRNAIRIDIMPGISPVTPVYDKTEFPEIVYGKATVVRTADEDGKPGEEIELVLYTYESEGHVVTMAYSPKCAKFSKTQK